jgi:hypothetical protein
MMWIPFSLSLSLSLSAKYLITNQLVSGWLLGASGESSAENLLGCRSFSRSALASGRVGTEIVWSGLVNIACLINSRSDSFAP